MASIETVVKVSITKGSRQVPLAGFGVPLIMGASNRFVDLVRFYQNVSDMLADGFLISDPEYIHAAALMSQSVQPVEFGIGKYTAPVAQVDTLAVGTLVDSHNYTFTINGTVITFNSGVGATQQSVLDGLNAALVAAFPTNAPATGVRTGTGGAALLTLTSTAPGAGITYTAIDADLTHVLVTPNHSIATDIAALQAVSDIWYGLCIVSKVASDIEQVAAYIETQKKIFVAASADSGIIGSGSTDVASILNAKAYVRTAILYSAQAAFGADAAWLGRMLPTGVGSATWKFKQLVGIVSDNLSATSVLNAQTKKANVYIPVGGVDITSEGVVASGEYIDVTRFIDWLVATMEANVYGLLINSDKIPFTNKGIATVENAVRQTLQEGVDNGGLSTTPAPVVTVPDVLNVSQSDKAARTLNNVVFTATLAGAIHKVNIQGFVSV